MSTFQYGQLLLFRDWPFNKHSCFHNVGVVLHTSLDIRKGLRLSNWHAKIAPVRGLESQCLRTLVAYKDIDREAVWFQQIQTDLGWARADNRTGRLMAPGTSSKERHSFQ